MAKVGWPTWASQMTPMALAVYPLTPSSILLHIMTWDELRFGGKEVQLRVLYDRRYVPDDVIDGVARLRPDLAPWVAFKRRRPGESILEYVSQLNDGSAFDHCLGCIDLATVSDSDIDALFERHLRKGRTPIDGAVVLVGNPSLPSSAIRRGIATAMRMNRAWVSLLLVAHRNASADLLDELSQEGEYRAWLRREGLEAAGLRAIASNKNASFDTLHRLMLDPRKGVVTAALETVALKQEDQIRAEVAAQNGIAV